MFLESIAYKNKVAPLLPFHLERITSTLKHFNSPPPTPSSLPHLNDTYLSYLTHLTNLLSSYTPPHSPDEPHEALYKGRFVYNPVIPGNETMEFTPYQIKPICTLKIVHSSPAFNYTFKYAERSELNALYTMRGEADDILIIKNGLVTDTSYTNVVFFDGQDWVTPTDPLLKGVMRSVLLKQGLIKTKTISQAEIKNYKSFKLINALRPFTEVEAYPVRNIIN